MALPGAQHQQSSYDWTAFAPGLRAVFSVAGLVMGLSFAGFGAFLHSLDFSLAAGLAMGVVIWALPGQVVFADSYAAGAGLLLTGLAVSITAIRLMPMTMLVLDNVRMPGAARWPEFILAHFIAVTLWIVSESGLSDMARPRKLPWLLGAGVSLMAGTICFTTAGYILAGVLPPLLSALLVFFTPSFFILGLIAGTRWRADYVAIAAGAIAGPVAHHYAPDIDLLIGGLAGGTFAYLLGRYVPAGGGLRR